jgi:hypothetical protein
LIQEGWGIMSSGIYETLLSSGIIFIQLKSLGLKQLPGMTNNTDAGRMNKPLLVPRGMNDIRDLELPETKLLFR